MRSHAGPTAVASGGLVWGSRVAPATGAYARVAAAVDGARSVAHVATPRCMVTAMATVLVPRPPIATTAHGVGRFFASGASNRDSLTDVGSAPVAGELKERRFAVVQLNGKQYKVCGLFVPCGAIGMHARSTFTGRMLPYCSYIVRHLVFVSSSDMSVHVVQIAGHGW